jgi:hypothetical protein
MQWQLQMTWLHLLATVPIIQVPLKVIMIIEYVWSTALSTIFKLYLCGHVYRWRKLQKIGVPWKTSYLYLICYMHIGHFLSEGLCLTPQKLDLYFYTPGFMSVKIVNDFTSYTFVNSRQFCCTNMNYKNLLQTSCIDIEIMIYVLSSVLLNPPRFPHENYVRFVPHLFVGEFMSSIFYLYVLRIVVFNMYLLDE